jgi:predicted Zn-dependent protease
VKAAYTLGCFAASLALGQQAGGPGTGVNWYSREKEAAMGAHGAAEVRRQVIVIDSPRIVDYLHGLARKLASHMPASEGYSWTVTLTADARRSSQHEPRAIPGGNIFVPGALFLEARDEGELAGMLAHSVAHVVARHGTRQATRGQLANVATIPLIFMGASHGGPAEDMLIPVGFLSFMRQFELQADRLAVPAMAAAGFDPSALHAFIDRKQQDPADPVRSGYPPRAERLTAIQQAIAELPARTYLRSHEFTGIQQELRSILPATPPKAPRLRR